MSDRAKPGDPSNNGTTIPSPAQIEAVAAEIRAGWSRKEYAKRAGVGFSSWNVPIVSAADVESSARRRDG
jgi:hypothetical protein